MSVKQGLSVISFVSPVAWEAWLAEQRRELEKNDEAREFLSTLDSRNRYAILYRIQEAKKPETRARRIEKYVAMLKEQNTIYP